MSLLKEFPQDFVWGTATASYQIEGGAQEGGRGDSIWDTFCRIPGKVANGENGDIACDHYHRYPEDIRLMAELGVCSYRFSISWSRIMPDGTENSINQAGIDFYNRVIDLCLENNIEPWVTLYHWDLPEHLHQAEGGWLERDIVDRFRDYSEVCFKAFGDRVKRWITINEAWVVAMLGYGKGIFAPGLKSNDLPYRVGHHLLLAHAEAVDVFRRKYASDDAVIGIANNCDWREAATESDQDKQAAQRALEFFLGWFADPVYLGDYPQVMRDRLGERLPSFTAQERKKLKGSSDFFGLNHYTTMIASAENYDGGEVSPYGNGGIAEDQDVHLTVDPEWPLTDMQWAVVPWGCEKMLRWIAERYDNPPIYITENGCAYAEEDQDRRRIEFLDSYLRACKDAVAAGVNLKGYFVWSLLDNFEWASGYSKRFGLHHVDYSTGERTKKQSAVWLSEQLLEITR